MNMEQAMQVIESHAAEAQATLTEITSLSCGRMGEAMTVVRCAESVLEVAGYAREDYAKAIAKGRTNNEIIEIAESNERMYLKRMREYAALCREIYV